MSFIDTIGSLAGSLGETLGAGLNFATDVLGSAASIKSSLDQLSSGSSGGSTLISGGGFGGIYGGQVASTGAGPGAMGSNLATTTSEGLTDVPTLLLFVGALAFVIYLARK